MTVLIIGGGRMGLSHLAIASQLVGKRNVAICDSSILMRFVFKRLGFTVFGSLDRALDKLPKLAAAVIATPTHSHYPIAKEMISRGVPSFIEKPLTLNVERSLELAELADAKGVDTQLGFVLRYLGTVAKLRAFVQSGQLGSLKSYTAEMKGLVITRPSTGWRTDFAKGGGCLNEYGPHLIDLCQFVFGEIESVASATMGRVYSELADDFIDIEFVNSAGVQGKLALNWCDASKRKSIIEIVAEFEYATVRIDNSAVHVDFSEDAPLTDKQKQELCAAVVPPRVGFYLRGEEFTLQLEAFLGRSLGRPLGVDPVVGSGIQAGVRDGLSVDSLIDKIAVQAGLK